MLIRLGHAITFGLPQPTPMVLTLDLHDSRRSDIVVAAPSRATPDVPMHRYRDAYGNTCARLVAPAGTLTVRADAVVRDIGLPDAVVPDAREVPVEHLPDEVLLFLLGSRYCETDRLSQMAWDLFGSTPPGWARVQAICDYVHRRIEFGYPHADATRTASQALEAGRGVCRDFAHSAVALCRCMNIPARYCTGYLGDIGIPPVDAPMDFSAWFEAYLGGRWYTFDARHNTPRIGRVLIARGRDASDVAISNTFGANQLLGFDVWTDETDDPSLSPRPASPPPLALAI
ncbi:transglutaminase-like domain-containing protein [Luteimonas kalidii]|uniref:Transglutaminase family protein n=1 Tax=Luteimonas kalidii TaxID=3042025 RepID=A0ABT6JR43_9GAMM|nr:transglutaminase family protein [Luteimonas kalidii]MDH5833153.1 transglutaminase family protein [Luteimonas kalidii]